MVLALEKSRSWIGQRAHHRSPRSGIESLVGIFAVGRRERAAAGDAGAFALGRRPLLAVPQVTIVAVGRRWGNSALCWRWPKTTRAEVMVLLRRFFSFLYFKKTKFQKYMAVLKNCKNTPGRFMGGDRGPVAQATGDRTLM